MKEGQAEAKGYKVITHNNMIEYIDKLYNRLSIYLKENNLKIDYVCPILRSGAVPAVYIANKLNIVKFLPLQVKHIKYPNDENKIEVLLDTTKLVATNKKQPVFLLVDALISTGTSVNLCIDRIKEQYKDSKIICISLMKQYGNESFNDKVIYEDAAALYNGGNKFSKEECDRLNIEYLHPLFPWEELDMEMEHPDDLEENIFF